MGDFDNFNDSSSDSSFDDEWRDFLNDSDSGTDSLNGNNDLDNFFGGSSQPQNNDTMSSFEQWGSENINNGFAVLLIAFGLQGYNGIFFQINVFITIQL